MKTLLLNCCLLILLGASAQDIKPCTAWETGFAQQEPKMIDGTKLEKYILDKLTAEVVLKDKTKGELGLYMYVNCKGEFSYSAMKYPMNTLSDDDYRYLLKKTEDLMHGIKLLEPAKVSGKPQDMIVKLIVKVDKKGRLCSELIY